MSNFTPKQRAVIQALALPPYPNLKQAAIQCGVSDGTVHNWNGTEAFRTAWQDARAANQAELREAAMSRLHDELPSLIDQKLQLGMNAQSEHVRHLELKDLVDRVLGQTTQKAEVKAEATVNIVAQLEKLWDRPLPPDDGHAAHES